MHSLLLFSLSVFENFTIARKEVLSVNPHWVRNIHDIYLGDIQCKNQTNSPIEIVIIEDKVLDFVINKELLIIGLKQGATSGPITSGLSLWGL